MERQGIARSRGAICALLVVAMAAGSVTVARAQTSTVPCYSYDEQCKGLIKKAAVITVVVVGALVALKIVRGKKREAASNAAPRSLYVSYSPTEGEALYHMVMSPVSTNCPGNWSMRSARLNSGSLPPGMKLLDDHTITGTPMVPGTWKGVVGVGGLSCDGRDGVTKNYGDLAIPVTFIIK